MNVAEVLNELGVPFVEGGAHKSVRHGWLGIRECPYCGSTKYHFAFAEAASACNCWSCGSHGFAGSLTKLSGKPYREVFNLIGVDFAQAARQERSTGKYLPPDTDYLGPLHRDYLRTRNIGPVAAANLWKVNGVGPLGGKYAWSLFLPVFLDGRAVSWTTRKISVGPFRYLTAPPERELLPIKSLLYGHDLVRGTAVVCEGPLDALRVGPGAVSTFGAQFSPKQVAKLAKIPRRVICYDSAGDVTGERMGQRLADALAPHDGETVLVELDAKDAAEASDREIRRLRRIYLD